jgi:hypothetical protein
VGYAARSPTRRSRGTPTLAVRPSAVRPSATEREGGGERTFREVDWRAGGAVGVGGPRLRTAPPGAYDPIRGACVDRVAFTLRERRMSTYYELPAHAAGSFDPHAAVTRCIESGAGGLLADTGALPPEFFDLSTGVAGEMLQRLALFGIRMAGVVPDPAAHSQPFQDLAREASRARHFRFFPTREDAVRWLESE